MRRLDRLSYLTAGKPTPRLQVIGRVSVVAVTFFILLIVVLVASDIRLSSTNIATAPSSSSSSSSSSSKFASTSPPKSYKANKGAALGLDANDSIKLVNAAHFPALLQAAAATSRRRQMIDLTQSPSTNSMQVLLNTWTRGSYSPVHRHPDYSEAFVVLHGALAFFTFDDAGNATCAILRSEGAAADRAIVIEKNSWHAMTAYYNPLDLLQAAAPDTADHHSAHGSAVVFEISGHVYDAQRQTKELAPFAPALNGGLDGEKEYFEGILKRCRWV